MSVAATVVFKITTNSNNLETLETIINKLVHSSIASESTVMVVVPLPDKHVAFGELVHLCNTAGYSYKTLWLNDQGDWLPIDLSAKTIHVRGLS